MKLKRNINTKRWKHLGELKIYQRKILESWEKCDLNTKDSEYFSDLFYATHRQIQEFWEYVFDSATYDGETRTYYNVKSQTFSCLQESVEAIVELIEENRQLKEQLGHPLHPSPDAAVLGTPHHTNLPYMK